MVVLVVAQGLLAVLAVFRVLEYLGRGIQVHMGQLLLEPGVGEEQVQLQQRSLALMVATAVLELFPLLQVLRFNTPGEAVVVAMLLQAVLAAVVVAVMGVG